MAELLTCIWLLSDVYTVRMHHSLYFKVLMRTETATGDGGKREDGVDKRKSRILSVPFMQHRNGKVQEQGDDGQPDPQPDHLLILVHGIFAKYVPLPH